MVVRKPASISFEQAAAIPTNGVTALQAVRDWARLRPGQHVLVNGAAGGVGTFAVQIAKALGAEATGVCGSGNVDLVRSLGADAVIDYTREDVTRGTRRFDVIFDFPHYATHSMADLRRVLTPKGTIIPASNTRNRWIGGFSRVLPALLTAPFVPYRVSAPTMAPNQADLVALAGLIESGKVAPVSSPPARARWCPRVRPPPKDGWGAAPAAPAITLHESDWVFRGRRASGPPGGRT